MRFFLFARLDALRLFWPQGLAVVRLRRLLVEMMATGTPDSQARFGQSVKGLLTEKVNTCGTDVIALTKQVLKGSRSSEVSGAWAPRPSLPPSARSRRGGAVHPGECRLLAQARVAFWVRFFSLDGIHVAGRDDGKGRSTI